jgi:hypothetical protein
VSRASPTAQWKTRTWSISPYFPPYPHHTGITELCWLGQRAHADKVKFIFLSFCFNWFWSCVYLGILQHLS